MVQLHDKESGSLLGSISDEELQFLIDNLEEEWDGDTDYYFNSTTIEMLVDAGADTPLIELLTGALGDKEGVEIEWVKL